MKQPPPITENEIAAVQDYYNLGNSLAACKAKFGRCLKTWNKYIVTRSREDGHMLYNKKRNAVHHNSKIEAIRANAILRLRRARLNWEEIQQFYDSGKTTKEVLKKYEIDSFLLYAAKTEGLFVPRTASETIRMLNKPRPPMSDATRKKIGQARKKFLREHPEKHNWKSTSKFTSPPCERLKEYIRARGIEFEPEFTPLKERFYSIDISFPEKMIALEVNGHQHYNNDKTLKPYYQEKHDLITAAGWTVIEVYFRMVYKDDYVKTLIDKIESAPRVNNFSYELYRANNINVEYVPLLKEKSQLDSGLAHQLSQFDYDICRRQKKYITRKTPSGKDKTKSVTPVTLVACPCCGSPKCVAAKKCMHCARIDSRKVSRPTKEELVDLIWKIPTTQLMSRFGVSDTAISKWCKSYGISKPPRGYWAKRNNP